jgi:hypothetical protein
MGSAESIYWYGIYSHCTNADDVLKGGRASAAGKCARQTKG